MLHHRRTRLELLSRSRLSCLAASMTGMLVGVRVPSPSAERLRMTSRQRPEGIDEPHALRARIGAAGRRRFERIGSPPFRAPRDQEPPVATPGSMRGDRRDRVFFSPANIAHCLSDAACDST